MANGLTHRRAKFVEAFSGDAMRAAAAAGYSGNKAALAVTGSRLLDDPKVQAAIEERGGIVPNKAKRGRSATARRELGRRAPPQQQLSLEQEIASDPAGAIRAASEGLTVQGIDPKLVLQFLMENHSVLPSHRVAAARELERIRIADEKRAAASGMDKLVRLRAQVREILAKKHARERADARAEKDR